MERVLPTRRVLFGDPRDDGRFDTRFDPRLDAHLDSRTLLNTSVAIPFIFGNGPI